MARKTKGTGMRFENKVFLAGALWVLIVFFCHLFTVVFWNKGALVTAETSLDVYASVHMPRGRNVYIVVLETGENIRISGPVAEVAGVSDEWLNELQDYPATYVYTRIPTLGVFGGCKNLVAIYDGETVIMKDAFQKEEIRGKCFLYGALSVVGLFAIYYISIKPARDRKRREKRKAMKKAKRKQKLLEKETTQGL